MAKTKRRPGGGRKPIGQHPKSEQFTTRLEPETHRALVEAADLADKSVSETAAHILREGLKKPTGAARNLSLVSAVALRLRTTECTTLVKFSSACLNRCDRLLRCIMSAFDPKRT